MFNVGPTKQNDLRSQCIGQAQKGVPTLRPNVHRISRNPLIRGPGKQTLSAFVRRSSPQRTPTGMPPPRNDVSCQSPPAPAFRGTGEETVCAIDCAHGAVSKRSWTWARASRRKAVALQHGSTWTAPRSRQTQGRFNSPRSRCDRVPASSTYVCLAYRHDRRPVPNKYIMPRVTDRTACIDSPCRQTLVVHRRPQARTAAIVPLLVARISSTVQYRAYWLPSLCPKSGTEQFHGLLSPNHADQPQAERVRHSQIAPPVPDSPAHYLIDLAVKIGLVCGWLAIRMPCPLHSHLLARLVDHLSVVAVGILHKLLRQNYHAGSLIKLAHVHIKRQLNCRSATIRTVATD